MHSSVHLASMGQHADTIELLFWSAISVNLNDHHFSHFGWRQCYPNNSMIDIFDVWSNSNVHMPEGLGQDREREGLDTRTRFEPARGYE